MMMRRSQAIRQGMIAWVIFFSFSAYAGLHREMWPIGECANAKKWSFVRFNFKTRDCWRVNWNNAFYSKKL